MKDDNTEGEHGPDTARMLRHGARKGGETATTPTRNLHSTIYDTLGIYWDAEREASVCDHREKQERKSVVPKPTACNQPQHEKYKTNGPKGRRGISYSLVLNLSLSCSPEYAAIKNRVSPFITFRKNKELTQKQGGNSRFCVLHHKTYIIVIYA